MRPDLLPTPTRPPSLDASTCALCRAAIGEKDPRVQLPDLSADDRLRPMSHRSLHEHCWARWEDRERAVAAGLAYWRARPDAVPSIGRILDDADGIALFSRSNPKAACVFVVPAGTGLATCVDGRSWEPWLARGRTPTGTPLAQKEALRPLRERLAAAFPTLDRAEAAVDRAAQAAVAARLDAEARAAADARLAENAALAERFRAGELRCPHCGGDAGRWFEGSATRAAAVGCAACGRSFR